MDVDVDHLGTVMMFQVVLLKCFFYSVHCALMKYRCNGPGTMIDGAIIHDKMGNELGAFEEPKKVKENLRINSACCAFTG